MAMCAMGLIGARPGYAASWSFTPHASLNAGYDDNVRFSKDAPIASSTAVLQLDTRLQRASDAFELSLTPRVTLARYDRESVLDRDDVSVDAQFLRNRERLQWRLAGQYVRDTTLTSELGTTGLVEINARHESALVSFSPTVQMTERWDATLQAAAMAHRYGNDADTAGLTDYDYNSLLTRTSYALNEYSSLAVDASWGRLSVPHNRTATEVNNYSANLSWRAAWSERWQANLGIGPTRVESVRFEDSGLGYSASLDRRGEVASWHLNWSREVTPNGRGVLSKRETAGIALSMQVSDRVATSLSSQWIRSQDFLPSLALSAGRVRYLNLAGALQWRITPTLSFSTSVAWAEQTTSAAAESYRANIGIVWNGQARGLQ